MGWTNKQVVEWVKGALERSGRTQRELAAVWNRTEGIVSRMFTELEAGLEPRVISAEEVDKVVELTGENFPSWPNHQQLQRTGVGGAILSVRGRLAAHVWTSGPPGNEQSEFQVSAVLHPRYPIEQQVAFVVVTNALPGERYVHGDFVIAVPFEGYRSKPLAGDEIIVRRQKDDLVSYVLKRAVREGAEVVLKPVLHGIEEDAGIAVELHGLVIGHVHFQG